MVSWYTIFLFGIFLTQIKLLVANVNLMKGKKLRSKRIINGYRPQKHYLGKYVVSIRFGSDDGVYGSNHLCAGTIISKRLILTAGHCVFGRDQEDFYIVAGNVDRLQKTNSERIYGVDKIVPYPVFNYKICLGDLALMHLSENLDFDGASIAKIALETEKPFPGMECVALGWGKILYNGPASSELVYMNVSVLSVEDCARFFHMSKGVICAGEHYFVEKTAGSGDSGGPLICNDKLEGVISYIVPIRTYFSSVWYYRRWIEENNAQQIYHSKYFLIFATFFYIM